MLQPANWREFSRYPVVAGTAALAIAVTCAWWLKLDISALFATAEIRRGQVWRLITTIFPHLGILHLLFNVYWLWVFGALIERVFGHAKTALLILFLALGSSAFDFALDQGGVGLSGVGYGMFGLLWVLSRHDERFHDAIDPRTVNLFVAWFLFCIFTTVTKISPVANVAHAAGAILGALIGLAITNPQRRLAIGAVTVAVVFFGLWGATLGRPVLNLSGKAGYDEGKWGYQDLLANRNQEAVRWLRDATKLQPGIAEDWFNLGLAYLRIGNKAAAKSAFERAHQLKPSEESYTVPDDN